MPVLGVTTGAGDLTSVSALPFRRIGGRFGTTNRSAEGCQGCVQVGKDVHIGDQNGTPNEPAHDGWDQQHLANILVSSVPIRDPKRPAKT